ncbi:MAG TPA: prolyl oligopeptidase family serine peptidase [Verrucomicrobiae bacterium]|nr:prolyl oligopeptidase family serine peptidase [Verrucomicrobiae bacterium]
MTRLFFGSLVCVLASLMASAASPDDLILREGLALPSVGRPGRIAFHTDPVESAIVTGKWTAPRAGDQVATGERTRAWESVTANTSGVFTNASLRGGYLWVTLSETAPRVALLNAGGHSLVYVNGEPRVGDNYDWGTVSVPVQLRAGTNEFLFLSGRGQLRAKLGQPRSPIAFDLNDLTLPDLLAGEKNDLWGAVILVNATTNFVTDAVIRASTKEGGSQESPVPGIPPLATRKVPFRLAHPGHSSTNQVPVTLELRARANGKRVTMDSTTVQLRLRAPGQTFKATFFSEIDGSLQYYGVRPAVTTGRNREPLAMFLSLHGASVEAIGQADAYSPKNWGVLVAPTNRRPYGFDWEDWGRRDAIEVLELAQARFKTDPRRVYLTGHSMGGHGTWQVGATFPDRFAALGPSAGWISFWSYAGARRGENSNPVRAMFDRAMSPSDTLALSTNYTHAGIYILHGDADDNVPVAQARTMRENLGRFHHDFAWHEQPGAGHWWDASDEPGADCVDWAPMFDLFARHELPRVEEVREVSFTTANPGVSARCDWATIYAQQRPLVMSTVNLRFDPGKRRFAGATGNVAWLALDPPVAADKSTFTVELDHQSFTNVLPAPGQARLWFQRDGDRWQPSTPPPPGMKNPRRYGPFKEGFGHRMIFVYGTRGTPEENAWAFAKARYDAENFWYRGNGAVDIVPDHAFNPLKERDRGVILYGNADSNAAWPGLLGDSPVQARRGVVRVGDREVKGDDLACLFVRPRPGSDVACVAAVSGSGPVGMRLTDRAPYFTSGVAFPDCSVFGADVLSSGFGGVRVAGFFGNDWGVSSGEFAWRE